MKNSLGPEIAGVSFQTAPRKREYRTVPAPSKLVGDELFLQLQDHSLRKVRISYPVRRLHFARSLSIRRISGSRER